MKRLKLVYFYFILLVLLVTGYFINNPLTEMGVYDRVNQYIGIIILPTLLFFILYGFIFMIKDKKKKLFLEVKLYLTFIFAILGIFLYVLYKLGISILSVSDNFVLTDEFYKKLISESIFTYKLGYLFTYIFYEILKVTEKFSQYPFKYFYYIIFLMEFILIFLICFNPIRKYIIKKIRNKRERRERAIIEAKLEEQIRIKEELEKQERIKIEKSKKREEEQIQERIENYKKEKKNKKQKQSTEELVVRMANTELHKIVTINQDDMSDG